MTGLIATFDITKTVTSPLTDQEIISIEAEVISNFEVSPEEVSTTGTQITDQNVSSSCWVIYSATGTITISEDDLTNEEVVEAFETALSDELNVHPSNIEVTYDNESGMLTYVITSDDIVAVDDAISIISRDNFASELELDSIEIDSIEPPVEILVAVNVIVDASNVHDASLAVDDVIQSLVSQDESYDVNGEGT